MRVQEPVPGALDAVIDTARRAMTDLDPEVIRLLEAHPEITADAFRAAAAAAGRRLAGVGSPTPTGRSASANDLSAVEQLVGAPSSRAEPEERERRLAPHRVAIMTIEPSLSSEEMAGRLGFKGRQSVLRWHRAGKLVGLETNRRGLRFPEDQIDGNGFVLDGIAELKRSFGDDHALWSWLTAPSGDFDGDRPLDRLRGDEDARRDVLVVAEAMARGDFG